MDCCGFITARVRRMGKVMFSVCPPPREWVPDLHPIILLLVPCPFLGVPKSQGGTPGQGYPSPGQDWDAPQPKQDWGICPGTSYTVGGTPLAASRRRTVMLKRMLSDRSLNWFNARRCSRQKKAVTTLLSSDGHTPLLSFRWYRDPVDELSTTQWRIQDFPEEGAPTPGGGHHPIIWPIFPENCMKMKKFWARGGRRVPRGPPP